MDNVHKWIPVVCCGVVVVVFHRLFLSVSEPVIVGFWVIAFLLTFLGSFVARLFLLRRLPPFFGQGRGIVSDFWFYALGPTLSLISYLTLAATTNYLWGWSERPSLVLGLVAGTMYFGLAAGYLLCLASVVYLGSEVPIVEVKWRQVVFIYAILLTGISAQTIVALNALLLR